MNRSKVLICLVNGLAGLGLLVLTLAVAFGIAWVFSPPEDPIKDPVVRQLVIVELQRSGVYMPRVVVVIWGVVTTILLTGALRSATRSEEAGVPPERTCCEGCKLIDEVHEILRDLAKSLGEVVPKDAWEANAVLGHKSLLVEIRKHDDTLMKSHIGGFYTDPFSWLKPLVPAVAEVIAEHKGKLPAGLVVILKVISQAEQYVFSCPAKELAEAGESTSDFNELMPLFSLDWLMPKEGRAADVPLFSWGWVRCSDVRAKGIAFGSH